MRIVMGGCMNRFGQMTADHRPLLKSHTQSPSVTRLPTFDNMSTLQTTLAELASAPPPHLRPPIRTLWALRNRHSGLSIPITPPNPTVLKPLLLPNLNLVLDFFQALLSRSPSCLPMRRGNGYQDGFLANIDAAETVGDGDGSEGVGMFDARGDGGEGLEGQGGIGAVGEMGDGFGMESVAGAACEERRELSLESLWRGCQ